MSTVSAGSVCYDELILRDRVHGRLYHDQDIFKDEIEKIWQRGWVYKEIMSRV